MQIYHATNFGECISAHRYFFHLHQKSDEMGLSPHQPAHFHPTSDISMEYFKFLAVSLMHHPHSEVLLLHEISLDFAGCKDNNPCIPCILAVLDPSLATKLNHFSTSEMILNLICPDKEPCNHHQQNDILGQRFGSLAQITAT